jgi:hypothetical protein
MTEDAQVLQDLDAIYKDVAITLYEQPEDCWSLPIADKRVIDHLYSTNRLALPVTDADRADTLKNLDRFFNGYAPSKEKLKLWKETIRALLKFHTQENDNG